MASRLYAWTSTSPCETRSVRTLIRKSRLLCTDLETPPAAKRQHILDVTHQSQGIMPSHLIACEVLTDVVPMPLAVVDIEVIAPTLDKPAHRAACTPGSLKRMIDAVLSNEGPKGLNEPKQPKDDGRISSRLFSSVLRVQSQWRHLPNRDAATACIPRPSSIPPARDDCRMRAAPDQAPARRQCALIPVTSRQLAHPHRHQAGGHG
jgi:hypothetical protein